MAMLSASADVFVPCAAKDPQDAIDCMDCWHFQADGMCSTSVPSLCTSTAGDLSDDRISPSWDSQDPPTWETERIDGFGGMLPDAAAMFDYSEVGVCELEGDVTFHGWAHTATCEDDLEHAAVEASFDIGTAAMMSMWSQGFSGHECLEPEEFMPPVAFMPPTPFASSCALARQLAPRPEGMGDEPLCIRTPGDSVDGLSELAPVSPCHGPIDAEAEWSFLPAKDSNDYVRKLTVPDSLLRDVPKVDIVACRQEEDAELAQCHQLTRSGREHDTSAAVISPPSMPVHDSSVEHVDEQALPPAAMGTFDGFFFSDPAGGIKAAEKQEEQSSPMDDRTYAAI